VVADVAERLEDITIEGVPRRSWMRLRLIRVAEEQAPAPQPSPLTGGEVEQVHEVLGSGGSGAGSTERIDEIASRTTGDPTNWRPIADLSGITDPLRLAGGQLLKIPESAIRKAAD
jgi:hypothetical protein